MRDKISLLSIFAVSFLFRETVQANTRSFSTAAEPALRLSLINVNASAKVARWRAK
jgi:hypothetical protein